MKLITNPLTNEQMKNKWKKNMLFFILLIASLSAYSQNTIKGIVLSSDGLTLPGVNISEEGKKNSVTTNMDGEYSIVVANNNTKLVFTTRKLEISDR